MTAATLPGHSTDPAGSAASPPAATVGRRARLVGVDVARGVALLGMIALHALYEADAAGRPTWSFTAFSGRAAAAFALLAGVGIAFMTGRRRVGRSAGRATVAALGVRAATIAAIGLVLGNVDTVLEAVILVYLAAMFVLAIPLVFLPTPVVAAIGVVMAVASPALSHVVRPHLPEPTLANPTFRYLVDDPIGLLTEVSVTGLFPALPWLAYLCAGLAIGRLELTRVRVAVALFASGAGLAVAAAAVSSVLLNRYGGLARIWAAQPESGLSVAETTQLLTFGGNGTTPTATWWWLAVDAPHTGTPPDLLGAAGAAIALLGAALLAGHAIRRAPRWLAPRWLAAVALGPLAAAGSMTLTFYAGHVLFINSEFDSYDAATGCLVQVAAVLLIGLAWRATVGRGPLEGLVAALAARAGKRP